MTNPTMYYFGCIRESGHYLWTEHLGHPSREEEKTIPWQRYDGALCPAWPPYERSRPEEEGEAALHHHGGWTALAFWDRSVDKRGGCNSVFFAVGTYDALAMIALAKGRFPSIWARYGFEVRVVEVSSPVPAKPFAVECSVCKKTGIGCNLWGWVHAPPGWFQDSMRPEGQAIGRWVCSVACDSEAPDPTAL